MMNVKELLIKIGDAERRHKKEINAIYLQYCNDNAEAKIGDIVTNGHTTILVETISGQRYSSSIPSIVFHGPELTKKLVTKKSGEHGCVGQCDDFLIIKVKG